MTSSVNLFVEGTNPLNHTDLRECKACPDLGQDHCPAYGTPRAKLMIVGDFPGKMELRELRPFCGPKGKVLTYFLDQVGISREETYVTYIVKCMPPELRPPRISECKECIKSWFSMELSIVNPKVVLLIGKIAFNSVIPERERERREIAFSHGLVVRTDKRAYVGMFGPKWFIQNRDLTGFVSLGDKVRELLLEGEGE